MGRDNDGGDAIDDLNNRWDSQENVPSVDPFDKAAARHYDSDDGETDLPSPSLAVEGALLDLEAERQYQKRLDRIIEQTKITSDDPLRDEKARQRKVFLEAERKLKAAVGPTSNSELYVGEYDHTPKPAAGFAVVAARRFSPKKLKAAAATKAAEEEALIERQLAETRERVRAKKRAERATLNVDLKK